MTLATADYVILGAALVAGIFGLFGGFSGALAFLAGVGAASAAVRFGWDALASRIETPWLLALAALAVALVAFGIARLIVKKTVHKMLAQPGDAIFGAIVSAVAGFALAVAATYLAKTVGGDDLGVESSILREVLSSVG